MDKDQGFPSTVNVTMKSWPRAKCFPRPKVAKAGWKRSDQWPEWITEPPSTMIDRETALPVSMYSRFFHQGFWGKRGPFEKYGQQALKLSTHQWETRGLKSQLHYFYVRKDDVAKAFGSRKVYIWMLNATSVLEEARQYVISEYMIDLTESVVEADRMGQRLHYEKKTWPRTDKKISEHIREIRRLRSQIPDILNKYGQAKSGPRGPNGPTWERALGAYIEQGRLIIVEASEMQRLLGIEVQYLQYLILGVHRQDEETRKKLGRYMDTISYRLRKVLARMADEAIEAATHVHEQYLIEIMPDLPQQLSDNLQQLTSRLETMSKDIHTTFPSTRQQLSNLADFITKGISHNDSGETESPPLQGFDLLVDASGIREIRTKRRQLQDLALRDLRHLGPEAPEHRIVNAWLRALRTQPQLAQATLKEAAVIKKDIHKWLAELDLGS